MKKNLIIVGLILFLSVVSIFSVVQYRKLDLIRKIAVSYQQAETLKEKQMNARAMSLVVNGETNSSKWSLSNTDAFVGLKSCDQLIADYVYYWFSEWDFLKASLVAEQWLSRCSE